MRRHGRDDCVPKTDTDALTILGQMFDLLRIVKEIDKNRKLGLDLAVKLKAFDLLSRAI